MGARYQCGSKTWDPCGSKTKEVCGARNDGSVQEQDQGFVREQEEGDSCGSKAKDLSDGARTQGYLNVL